MITIIITVFNQEKYLERCLNSILNQSVKDYEVIVINDGSTDNSINICNEYKIKYDNIRVIDIKNQGVSNARNQGILHSSKEWIMFIDGDDFVSENYIENVIKQIKKSTETQLILSNYKIFKDDNTENSDRITIDFFQKNEAKKFVIMYEANNLYLGSSARACWGKTFKKEILINNQISFNKNIRIGEDMLFVIKYLDYVNSVSITDSYDYVYRIHNDSIMNKYKETLFEQYESLYKELLKCNVNDCLYYFLWEAYIELFKNEMLYKNSNINDSEKWKNLYIDKYNKNLYNIGSLPKIMKLLHIVKKLPKATRRFIMYSYVIVFFKKR